MRTGREFHILEPLKRESTWMNNCAAGNYCMSIYYKNGEEMNSSLKNYSTHKQGDLQMINLTNVELWIEVEEERGLSAGERQKKNSNVLTSVL